MKYQMLALISIMALSGCGVVKSGSGENTYLNAKIADSLKIPQQLSKTTNISPIYQIPEGQVASVEQGKVSNWPPQFIGPGTKDEKHKSAK